MHKYYFPRCKVEGPIEPAARLRHMGFFRAIPQKCYECEYLFEGDCTRYFEEVGRHLYLDYGPCSVNGPTDPIYYESKVIKSNAEIPRKCKLCKYLGIHPIQGIICTENIETWGDFSRGLDWGTWEPEVIYFELPLTKTTNQKLNDLANKNDQINFIKEHRRVNPNLSLKEARNDFLYLRNKLKMKF